MAGLLAPQIKFRYTDANGAPLSGGKVFTYITGTSTLLATWSNASGTLNTNPVILDSRGEADIYLQPGKAYRFTVTSAADAVIETTDGIYGASPAGGSEWLNLLSFGADPTGVADSTTAIQAWITAATTAPRYTAYVPAGVYRMTAGVTINGRISMVGDGMNNSVFQFDPVNGTAFSWTADGTYSTFKGIKAIHTSPRVVGNTATAFKTFQGAACVLYQWDQCWIEGFQLWGIDLNDSFNCSFTNGRLRRNGVVGTLAAAGADGQGGGMRLQRITFTGAATTGNDYSNNYITGNHFGIKIEPSGNNNKAFNTRLDNCIFEECYVGLDLRNLGTGGRGRYQFLNTCYFEANIFAGALLDEGTSIACYQNSTTAGTGIAPSWSTDGKDGIIFGGRYVEDRPSRFGVGNNSNTPASVDQKVAFSVDKGELTNYISQARFNQNGAIKLVANSTDVDFVSIRAGNGSPEGVVTADGGSLFLRKNGSAVNNTFYIKTTDGTNTDWQAVGSLFGGTANRPIADASNKGVRYYDTDIIRSVVSNGAGLWREYNGLTSVKGLLADVPAYFDGARYWATDADCLLIAAGGRWRNMYDTPEFVSAASGGTTTIAARGGYVVNTTAAVLATHTVTLPSGASAVSGDKVIFATTGAITALTVNAGAATVNGSPTTLAANSSFEYVYNDGTTTWYRVR